MGFGKEIVSADSVQDLSHFFTGVETTSVSNDRWLQLWFCDPTNGEKGGYLLTPVQKNLFWGNVSEVETTEKFNFPSVPNAQQRNFQCSIWPDTVECPWAKAPVLLWTCSWKSLKMYFSGPVSAETILSLFVCFTKMWWDSTTPNCYDHRFYYLV